MGKIPRSSYCILTQCLIINNRHLPNCVASVRMTGGWQSTCFRCSVRGEDTWKSHKKQIEMTDLHNWHLCDSLPQMVQRNKSPSRASYCTSMQICKSSMYDEGRALVRVSRGANQELVWERGLIKDVRERVSHAVSQCRLSSAWLIRSGWCDKQSWISLSSDIDGIVRCVVWHYSNSDPKWLLLTLKHSIRLRQYIIVCQRICRFWSAQEALLAQSIFALLKQLC